MEHTIAVEAIKLIVMLVAGFIAGWVAHLKKNHPEKLEALDLFVTKIDKIVKGAQQIMWSDSGEARKRTVTDALKQLRDRYKVDLTDDELNLFIEAAVYVLNQEDGVGYISMEDDDGNG